MKKTFIELWNYKTFLYSLVLSELRTRYKGSFFGFLWTFINPLMMLGVYYIVFSVIMKVDIKNYAMFLFIGILAWNMISSGVLSSISVIVRQSGLVKKIYFPRMILPLSVVGGSLINYLLSLLVMIPLLIVSGIYPNTNWLYIPLILLMQIILTTGLALIFSSINVYLRDTEHIMGIIFMLLFYLTPVVYTLKMLPHKYQQLFKFNPISDVVMSYQYIYYYDVPPHWKMMLYGLVISFAIFMIGYYVFQRLNKKFAEEV